MISNLRGSTLSEDGPWRKAFLGTPRVDMRVLVTYRERVEVKQKEEVKGHNHPAYEKCGSHCPRNANYKGPERKSNPFIRNKRK
jgi:hypothetical protein